jgi:hypothetical protein
MEIPIMAHFAEIDEKFVVLRTVVVDNRVITDENGVEQESRGVEYCRKLLGGIWIQSSYNEKFRKNFALPGYVYDAGRDAFIPPMPPYGDWIFDEESCKWLLVPR